MRTDLRSLPSLLLLSLAACTSDVAIVTVPLALVPEDVASISIWATDPKRRLVVASATVAPPIDEVQLGVPAETPLEFVVLARTDQPGPLDGRMPGYVGRTTRVIPLGREQVELRIVAHPAGVLSLTPRVDPELSDRVTLRLEGEIGAPIPLEIDPERPGTRVLPLRVGRYRLAVTDRDLDRAAIDGGEGFYVQRRVESVGVFGLRPPPDVPPPEAVHTLQVSLQTAGGEPSSPPVRTGTTTGEIGVRIDGLDLSGEIVEATDVEVEVEIESTPEVLIGTRRLSAVELPAELGPIAIVGGGRMRVRARARIDERVLGAELRANVLRPSVEPGAAARLDLIVLDADALTFGSRIVAELLDDRGLYASGQTGALDFSESDPWVFFPDGPEAQLSTDQRGHLYWRAARPSGPRGLFVVLAATLTSTAPPGTLTASVALPVLESNE